MGNSYQDLLQKISYIEADVEVHKQILFSIPSDQKDELEEIIKKIAAAKEDIKKIHSEIQEKYPEEFKTLIRIEESVAAFKKFSSETDFTKVVSLAEENECSLSIQGEKKIFCLVKACDKKGNWTIISTDGELLHFSQEQVIL